MTNSDESTGSVAPGLRRRRFLQATGPGAAAAAAAGLNGGPAAAADSSAVLPAGWSGTIRDVKHVVILMQENRIFDHYFGTLYGKTFHTWQYDRDDFPYGVPQLMMGFTGDGQVRRSVA